MAGFWQYIVVFTQVIYAGCVENDRCDIITVPLQFQIDTIHDSMKVNSGYPIQWVGMQFRVQPTFATANDLTFTYLTEPTN